MTVSRRNKPQGESHFFYCALQDLNGPRKIQVYRNSTYTRHEQSTLPGDQIDCSSVWVMCHHHVIIGIVLGITAAAISSIEDVDNWHLHVKMWRVTSLRQ